MFASLILYSIGLSVVPTGPGLFDWFSSVQETPWDAMAMMTLLVLGVAATILLVWPVAFLATARFRGQRLSESGSYVFAVAGVLVSSGLAFGVFAAMAHFSDLGRWAMRWLVVYSLAVVAVLAHVALDLRALRTSHRNR